MFRKEIAISWVTWPTVYVMYYNIIVCIHYNDYYSIHYKFHLYIYSYTLFMMTFNWNILHSICNNIIVLINLIYQKCGHSAPARLESQEVNRSLGLYSNIYGINNNTYHLLAAHNSKKSNSRYCSKLKSYKIERWSNDMRGIATNLSLTKLINNSKAQY